MKAEICWHKYPIEKPKHTGFYVVTIGGKSTVAKYFLGSWTLYDYAIKGDVVAWAELPDPFKE